jgi:hypothetical protein
MLGEVYKNDMFVGDVTGNPSHFELNENRREINLNGPLPDRA